MKSLIGVLVCLTFIGLGQFSTSAASSAEMKCTDTTNPITGRITVICRDDGTGPEPGTSSAPASTSQVVKTREVPCNTAVTKAAACASMICDPVVTGGPILPANQTEQLIGGVWQPTGVVWCSGLNAAAAALPGRAELVAIAQRSLPRAPIVSAPSPGALALVNVQIIMWLDTPSGTQPLPSATLLGRRIEFRAQVTHSDWTFGDGAHARADGPGRPYDAVVNPCRTRVCPDYFGHSYVTDGPVTVGATAAWAVGYRIDGGPWQDLGELTTPAPALPLTIRAARSVLVPR